MKALCLLLLLSALPALAAEGPTPYPDAKNEAAWPGQGPIRLFDWMPVNRQYFWTQRAKDQGAIVFVGDSLTGNWKSLAKSFPDWKVANRGIGGDTSRGVLFRFQEDVLALKPRAIVLCIGANDLSAHGDPAQAEKNVAAMLADARAQDAQLPLILCNTPPRDNPKAPTRPGAHADLNARLKRLAAATPGVEFVDLFALLGNEGQPVPEYFAEDRLHLAEPGYRKWAEALQPLLAKLGPPAK